MTLDTSRVLFVCTGAFADLPDTIRRRLTRRARSASARAATSPPKLADGDALAQVIPQDLVEFGPVPEIVGRFAAIAPLHLLSVSDPRTSSATSSTRRCRAKRQFALHGVALDVPGESREALAKRAIPRHPARAGLLTCCAARSRTSRNLPELVADGVTAARARRRRGRRRGAELVRGEPLVCASGPSAEMLCVGALQPPTPSSVRANKLFAEIALRQRRAAAPRAGAVRRDRPRAPVVRGRRDVERDRAARVAHAARVAARADQGCAPRPVAVRGGLERGGHAALRRGHPLRVLPARAAPSRTRARSTKRSRTPRRHAGRPKRRRSNF